MYSLLDTWTAPYVRVPVRTLYAKAPSRSCLQLTNICIEGILQCGFVLRIRKANLDLVHNT